jgi:hypothetical protein
LFFDKKDLTNGIDWLIPCVMNSNEILQKTNPRLNKIKTVSRIVKYATFVFLALSIAFFLLFFVPVSLASFHKISIWYVLFLYSFQIVVCFWYWKLIQLFRFYEKGLIFTAETIRCIKTLGILWVMGWLLLTALHFSSHKPSTRSISPPEDASASMQTTNSEAFQVLPKGISSPINSPVVTIKKSYIRIGFFYFDFGTGIDFGSPLIGMIVFLIAWIMDEGRKIQEEQELTV